MTNPCLFIVAGPNGAGKSLFSKELTATELEVFDGDKEKQKALTFRMNFAFETNFSSNDPMSTAREFKSAGYDIHLIFMGLNTLIESMERVAYRVRKGGHRVSEDSIRYNYEYGFKNLYKYVSEFDLVTLLGNDISLIKKFLIPQEILHI